MTEVDPGVPRTRPHVHVHGDHHGVKGNAYNFASTPQHATAFDLVQGQMGGINCFRQVRLAFPTSHPPYPYPTSRPPVVPCRSPSPPRQSIACAASRYSSCYLLKYLTHPAAFFRNLRSRSAVWRWATTGLNLYATWATTWEALPRSAHSRKSV